mmetsp:Transcript_33612/g.103474  ORF Transcript_33612/g.103474 Transcript_33612/m.103474 type:complete len:207 (-) Transcript_33612:1406-2026(-)
MHGFGGGAAMVHWRATRRGLLTSFVVQLFEDVGELPRQLNAPSHRRLPRVLGEDRALGHFRDHGGRQSLSEACPFPGLLLERRDVLNADLELPKQALTLKQVRVLRRSLLRKPLQGLSEAQHGLVAGPNQLLLLLANGLNDGLLALDGGRTGLPDVHATRPCDPTEALTNPHPGLRRALRRAAAGLEGDAGKVRNWEARAHHVHVV